MAGGPCAVDPDRAAGPVESVATQQFTAEATATFRRTGGWSVCLGPAGFLRRFYLRETVGPVAQLEPRLGILATCLGSLLIRALEKAGILNRGMRATLQCVSPSKLSSYSPVELSVEGQLLVDCDADQNTVQAYYERQVRTDPLISLLTQDFESVGIRVSVHSSVHIRIG
jgi:hypothetical protein